MFSCSVIFPVAFILLLVQSFSHGHKGGAPALSCSTMAPGHGVSPQASPAPYNITVGPISGGAYRIKLLALSDYFTGYLLRPKVTPKLVNATDDFSGTFVEVPADSKILNCGAEEASAVTHANNAKKRSVEVDWRPPEHYEGVVTFVATFVRNFSTFWMHVQSLPVQVAKRSTSSRAPYSNSIDAQLNAALLSVYEGCGSIKNCVAFPEDCLQSKTCNGAASVQFESGAYQIEMFAKGAAYVAIGFSDDAAMGGDNVVECADEGGKVQPHRSWNEPNRKSNKRLEDSNGVNLVNGLSAEGAIYCKIRIDPVTHVGEQKFDLNSDRFFLLLAAGTKLSDRHPGVGFHDISAVSTKTSYLLSEVSPEPTSDSFYGGCNSIKTCFGVPEGCVEKQNCYAVTAVSVQGNRFIFSMSAKNAAYVATGLSDDLYMGDDTVIECVNNGTVQAYQSWNVPNRKDNIRPDANELEKLSGSVTDDVLQCTVAFDPKDTKSFQYDEKYYLLLAAGAGLNVHKVGFHNLAYKASMQQVSLPSVQKTVSFYNGCERSKACFGNKPGCVKSESCNFAVAISSDFNNRYTFHLTGDQSPAYVAVGLSTDAIMGDDVVFECVRDPQTNQVRSFMSWNVGGQKANERLSENYLQLVNGSFIDGKLQCVIVLDNPVFNVRGKTYNLARDKYILMVASGTKVTAPGPDTIGNVHYHDIGREVGAEPRALADVTAVKAASKLLLLLHGSFMVAAWIGLASLGIVMARYYKQTWVNGSCFGKDVWFFWHRLFMYVAVILTIAGSVMIYIHSGGFIMGTPGETHMWFGFATFVLAILQPIGAFLRPSPGSSRRPIFNWLHWLLGNSAHIVAIVTIFLAVDLSKAELPKWTDYILVAFVAYYVVTHLLLSFLGWKSDSSGKGSINEIQLKNINPPRNIPPAYERERDSPYSGARKFLFSLHFLIIVGFSVLLILLIVWAPVA